MKASNDSTGGSRQTRHLAANSAPGRHKSTWRGRLHYRLSPASLPWSSKHLIGIDRRRVRRHSRRPRRGRRCAAETIARSTGIAGGLSALVGGREDDASGWGSLSRTVGPSSDDRGGYTGNPARPSATPGGRGSAVPRSIPIPLRKKPVERNVPWPSRRPRVPRQRLRPGGRSFSAAVRHSEWVARRLPPPALRFMDFHCHLTSDPGGSSWLCRGPPRALRTYLQRTFCAPASSPAGTFL